MPQENNQVQQMIINKLGLSGISKDQQNELLAKMAKVLFKRIFVETLEVLGEEKAEKYKEMIDKEKPNEEVEKFLKENIKDYEEFIKKITDEFMEDMKKTNKMIEN